MLNLDARAASVAQKLYARASSGRDPTDESSGPDASTDAFETVFTKHMGFRHHEFLRELGRKWGLRHAFRLEQHVQREYGKTLRELETQMALELLSSSIGVLGLGQFDADLSRRDAGIIVIKHHESPFPGHFVAVAGGACPILSGFHSAVLTYLSGRRLSAREFICDHFAAFSSGLANFTHNAFDAGWLLKIEADSLDPVEDLMDAKAYTTFVAAGV